MAEQLSEAAWRYLCELRARTAEEFAAWKREKEGQERIEQFKLISLVPRRNAKKDIK